MLLANGMEVMAFASVRFDPVVPKEERTMNEVKYTRDHEWIQIEGDIATIGVTHYAQEQLGDVVYVELPDVGKAVTKGAEAAVIESVKAASEVYVPITGEILEVNESLNDNPSQINQDAQGNGWFMKIRIHDEAELGSLMSADEYASFVESLG